MHALILMPTDPKNYLQILYKHTRLGAHTYEPIDQKLSFTRFGIKGQKLEDSI